MVAEGNRRTAHRYDYGEVKKGPWKAEEDEVLRSHVRKHGPRDWSSIRSKGLLQRTGKSCRLRWVNKLRPNLKNGVKFTAEEERIVLDLQAQIGNKWAKIATYLSGRTDNDVKNFWSSRQKRLARILQTSAPSSSMSQRRAKEVKAPILNGMPSDEASEFSEDRAVTKVPLPELVYPNMLTYEQFPFPLEYISPEKKPVVEPLPHVPLPCYPQQLDFLLPPGSQEFMPTLGDPTFIDVFEYSSGPPLGTAPLTIEPPFVVGDEESYNMAGPDTFIDDFPPIDMFDPIESLPSPSQWS